jgi:hypothetical protein
MNYAIKNHKNIVVNGGSQVSPCELSTQLHAVSDLFFYVLFIHAYATENPTPTAHISEQSAYIPVRVRPVAKDG